MKTTLEQTGYAVDLSTDGEDGHFMGSTEDYDAVVLDLGLPEIERELATLPQGRTPTVMDWQKISRSLRKEIDARIQLLTRTRNKLDECIGCGCLSLQACPIYNHDDELSAQGPGARRWPVAARD